MSDKFADNPRYVEYERLLMQLHSVIAEEKGDSEEADAIRVAMEPLWRHLSPEEIDRLDGLSADIYMLQDDEILTPFDQSKEELGQALREAVQKEQWEAILSLLRHEVPGLTQETRALYRAKAYDYLGHAEVSMAFLTYALRLAPDIGTEPSEVLV